VVGRAPNSEQENLALRTRTSVRAVKWSKTVGLWFLTSWCAMVYSTAIITQYLKNTLFKCVLFFFFPETTIIELLAVKRKILPGYFTAGGGLVSIGYSQRGPAPWSKHRHYILSLEHLYINN